MAVYKVPQDVEADDKLLGPFSFRQFIYLIIAAAGIALAWGLGRLFLPLAIAPAPIILLFGALALPARNGQPAETYLAALLSFYMKPRARVWRADGVQSQIEILVPKTADEIYTKDLSHAETEKRLEYLANLVDSHGWSVRGVSTPVNGTVMQDDVFFESQQVEDILESGEVAQSFEDMLDESAAKHRQEMMKMMSQPASASVVPPLPDPYAALSSLQSPQVPVSAPTEDTSIPSDAGMPQIKFSPYPQQMRQAVINPAGTTPSPTSDDSATSHLAASPAIINLANNSDLSIETLAHEAQRIHDKEAGSLDKDEVVISLH